MARYAVHRNGIVTNVIEATPQWIEGEGILADLVPAGAFVSPGSIRSSAGVFSEPEHVVPVPASVTMRQARLALMAAGKLAAVEAAIDALSDPTKTAARIEWEYSNEVQRHNGLVAALGPALSLTSDQIDALFIGAAKL